MYKMILNAVVGMIAVFACSSVQAQSIPSWGNERFMKWRDKYSIADYLNPRYLEEDFSGDGKKDLAVAIERKSDKKKGILILLKESASSFAIGAGSEFGNGGDNFDWANAWKIFTDKVAHETIVDDNGDVQGSKEVKLLHAAISISQEEGSGGLIYYDGEKFVWIQQGD